MGRKGAFPRGFLMRPSSSERGIRRVRRSEEKRWATPKVAFWGIAKAPVAQLDRAPDFESVGRTFESCRARQSNQGVMAICYSPFLFNSAICPTIVPHLNFNQIIFAALYAEEHFHIYHVCTVETSLQQFAPSVNLNSPMNPNTLVCVSTLQSATQQKGIISDEWYG